jgi:hypothetical protein
MKSNMVCTHHQRDQVKEDKMDGVCTMHEKEEKCVEDFGGDTCKKEASWKS